MNATLNRRFEILKPIGTHNCIGVRPVCLRNFVIVFMALFLATTAKDSYRRLCNWPVCCIFY